MRITGNFTGRFCPQMFWQQNNIIPTSATGWYSIFQQEGFSLKSESAHRVLVFSALRCDFFAVRLHARENEKIVGFSQTENIGPWRVAETNSIRTKRQVKLTIS